MATLKLKHVKTVVTRGRKYYYFNTGQKADDKPIYTRLPDPASASFFATYGALKAGRTKRENAKALMTVTKLIELYERSPDFDAMARESRRIYSLTLRKIEHEFGMAPADELESRDVTLFMDQHSTTPGAANTFRSTLASLYKWGRKRHHTTAEPTKDVDKLPTGEHDPWPEALLERGLKSPDDRVRLAVHLLYFTGQRISDVVKMRWSDIEGEHITVVQKKTGTELDVKMHSRLQEELAKTPRKGFHILGRHDGRQIGPQPIRIALKKFAGDYVPHGLRKNAVIALLEAGCSENQVGGITGQSPQMVRHYAKKINRRTLGDAAVLMWENK